MQSGTRAGCRTCQYHIKEATDFEKVPHTNSSPNHNAEPSEVATESGSPATYKSEAEDSSSIQPIQAETAERSISTNRTSTETHRTEGPSEVAKEHATSAHAANACARKATAAEQQPQEDVRPIQVELDSATGLARW